MSCVAARNPAMTPKTGARSSAPSSTYRERELEGVVRLSDGDDLLAHLAQRSVGALGQRLAAKPRERLRRAEPLRGAADEQHARRG